MASDKTPLNPNSSQSDIDEIENLFHVNVQPVSQPLEVPPPESEASVKPVPPLKQERPSAAALPPGGNTYSFGSASGSVSNASASGPGFGAGPSSAAPSGFGGGSATHSTLTEPVLETLKRDLLRVANNLQQVVFPNPYREDIGRALRDWDLWGPFFFIIFLSLVLSSSASENKGKVFAVVFAVLSSGAIVLTLNVLLLGGKIIFLQSLSVLGYCLFPLDVGALVCLFVESRWVRLLVVLSTLAWSSWSAYPFVSGSVSQARRALAVYPVLLLYLSVGFLVLAND